MIGNDWFNLVALDMDKNIVELAFKTMGKIVTKDCPLVEMNNNAPHVNAGTWDPAKMDLTTLDVREPVKDYSFDGVLWKIEGYNPPIPLRQDAKQRIADILKSENHPADDPQVRVRRAFRNPANENASNTANARCQYWVHMVIQVDSNDWTRDIILDLGSTMGWSWEENIRNTPKVIDMYHSEQGNDAWHTEPLQTVSSPALKRSRDVACIPWDCLIFEVMFLRELTVLNIAELQVHFEQWANRDSTIHKAIDEDSVWSKDALAAKSKPSDWLGDLSMSMMARKGGFGTANWRPVGNKVYGFIAKRIGVMPFCWDPNNEEYGRQNMGKKEEFAGNFLEFSYLYAWREGNFTWIQSLVCWASFFTSTKDWKDKLLSTGFDDTHSDRQTRKRKPDHEDRLADDSILAKATKVLSENWNEEKTTAMATLLTKLVVSY